MFLFRNYYLSEKKEIRASLKSVYGVGVHKANMIANLLGFAYPFFNNKLNDYLINNILFLLNGFVQTSTNIIREIDNNINKLSIINSYRGSRHKLTLPVRGQRSRTNAGTQRNKRVKDKEDQDEIILIKKEKYVSKLRRNAKKKI
jgi:small subunit ribosomal protein S13